MMKQLDVLLYVTTLFYVFTIAQSLESGERCTTPAPRSRGTCINLNKCPQLLQLLQQESPLSPETAQFLRESHCGFEGRSPLVCCPTAVGDATPTPPPSGSTVPRPKDVSRHRNVRMINSNLCGMGSQSRIVGGNETDLGEYPWMALLAYRTSSGVSFRCGGSLISNRYILTAAHCVLSTSRLKLVSVRLGEQNTETDPDCVDTYTGQVCAPSPVDVDVEETTVHPQYSTTKLNNDIALLRLASPVDVSSTYVRPICLPVGLAEQTKNLDRKKLIVAGWGATDYGNSSPELLKVGVPVVPTSQCAATYKAQYKFDVNANQLCAGGSNLQQDSCNGDSGGPLKGTAFFNNEPRFVQYGVVSYGHRVCGTAGVPGVYTRVGHYMDWILNTMRP